MNGLLLKKRSGGEGTLKRELDALITQMHSAGVAYNEAVRQFKRRYILEVLAQHRGNQCKAAEELGMHRNTLSRTLAELELDTAQLRNGMRRPPRSDRSVAQTSTRLGIRGVAGSR
jgi:DNA-binding NtrC family response regulator